MIIRTDVTELKKSERDLNSARLTAEAANRTKSEFLANMSHELRTPLNAILGFSEALLHEIFAPLAIDKQREYVDGINESGLHLLDLINDILDVSAIEADKLEITATDVDLTDIVDAASQMVRQRAEQRGVDLNTDINDTRPIIHADERRMKQVMVNLLSNAVKFTEAGGSVTVSADTNNDGSTTIFIKDNGIGMTSDEISRAMVPFAKVRHDVTKDQEGTGLGLPLTKMLIEAQGGRLIIESEPDIGTTVKVHFPKELRRNHQSREFA